MLQHNNAQLPDSLDDDALTQRVVSLVGNEREVLVDFLHHLGELDARRLYLAQGYPTLFEYCSAFLRLSNASAHRRYTTARLMRRFPVIADFLRSGRLTLTRVALLREVLTEQNHAEILERATHGTEKDVERLVATLNPKPNVTDGIRKLPSPRPLPAVASSVPMPVPLDASTSAVPASAGARELFPASGSMPLDVPRPPSAVPGLHQPEELAVAADRAAGSHVIQTISLHPGAGATGSLEPRRRPLRLREQGREAVQLEVPGRGAPHRSLRPRRTSHRRKPQPPLPAAQPP